MLRVASFNIRNGRAWDGWNSWPLRRRATLAAIEGLDADIVGLQESYRFQLRWLAKRLAAHDVVATGREANNRGEHCPLFARRSVARILSNRTRWYGPTPDIAGSRPPGANFPRIATTCRIELIDSGTSVAVTNTHLDSRSSEFRAASAEQLIQWLAPDIAVTPTVVVGDFNAVPADAMFATLAAAGLREVLPPDAGGTNHRFTGRTDGRRLDHILVSDHFEVVTAKVSHARPGNRLPSDHWPVVADLRLT